MQASGGAWHYDTALPTARGIYILTDGIKEPVLLKIQCLHCLRVKKWRWMRRTKMPGLKLESVAGILHGSQVVYHRATRQPAFKNPSVAPVNCITSGWFEAATL